MRKDPLFVVNPKSLCSFCQGDRKARKKCSHCKSSGFNPIDLSNLWSPSAGFLVCGGPSLNNIPKEKLSERGIVSLAVNNSAGHVQSSAWVFGDPQGKFHHGNHLDPKNLTFAPMGKLFKTIVVKDQNGKFRDTTIRLCDCPGVFGFSRSTHFYENTFLSDETAHWGMGGNMKEEEKTFTILDTMMLGLRLLHYLGCPRVYMLGVDFNASEKPYAFEQDKKGKSVKYFNKSNVLLKRLRPIFEANNFYVYNCNPESNCDAFDHVPFNIAYQDCKSGVPPDPFDLSQWYEKTISENDISQNKDKINYDSLNPLFNGNL